ncbi:hypothetical protein BS50DRAFT_570273 [Corynespora cassiicola Philippines]|uniref:Acyl-CoA dehydrogenase/oxidase C-terminal n=1 Tax=Corynespora cassiicola Philippines TaxID=1448308 RepID=A0A2T2NZD3_CORCC|nr:hypothetical protein BS50DRAFT_570273 [Corynespora cassiicola Philippines]
MEPERPLTMSPRPQLQASSATSGFFQALPKLPPQYTIPNSEPRGSSTLIERAVETSDDVILARIVNLYLPRDARQAAEHVHRLSRVSLDPSVLVHSTDAEINHPVLRSLTTFGEKNKIDPLWTTTGWKRLKQIGFEEGVVGVAYDESITTLNRRVYEFALNHVWTCTATMTGCPMSMTDGAAALIRKHLADSDGDQPGRGKVLKDAYRRLTSRDPSTAWTSGQWMTERTGGSDVSGTETVATRVDFTETAVDAVGMPLGPWKIDGFKWFSSATDSEMAVLLARTTKGGLSAFYIPMRIQSGTSPSNIADIGSTLQTELNGITIQRLKNKLGTKSLPTAELELKGARGWLIGTEGEGVKEIAAILNITRLQTAAGSAANWSRGLAVCRAYTKVRKVRNGLLSENPAHLRWLADETVKYWAATHFAFFGVALQGSLEQDWTQMVDNTNAKKLLPRDKSDASALLRLLTPVMKAQISVASVDGLRQCMECLGGVGYCENNEDGGLMNIAKIYRDNLVNPIWEGTVNVMAEDVVRVLTDKRLGNGNVLDNVLASWTISVLEDAPSRFDTEKQAIVNRLQELAELCLGTTKEELLYHGREILEHIEAVVCSCLLLTDARLKKDDVIEEVTSRWIRSKFWIRKDASTKPDLIKTTEMDKRVLLGVKQTRLERL